eukprot:SAG31_NODE_849_length_11529_cov_3.342257_11_plen_104_part_00
MRRTDKEKLFASAVWAQDVIVGAVLDELEALMIEKDTIVFFSGDKCAKTSTHVLQICPRHTDPSRSHGSRTVVRTSRVLSLMMRACFAGRNDLCTRAVRCSCC